MILKKNQKKGQLESVQTAMLLMFFVIAIVIFMLFLFSQMNLSQRQLSLELKKENSYQKAISIVNFDLYSCHTGVSNCIDGYRLKAFLELYEDNKEFKNKISSIFGYSNITIIFEDFSLNTNNAQHPNVIQIYYNEPETKQGVYRFKIPVLYHNSTIEKTSLVSMEIEIYD